MGVGETANVDAALAAFQNDVAAAGVRIPICFIADPALEEVNI
jgi:hypothetical protein